MNIEKYFKKLEDVVSVYSKQRIILWVILWPLTDYRQLSFSVMYMDREMFGHDGILPNLAVDVQPIWEPTTYKRVQI